MEHIWLNEGSPGSLFLEPGLHYPWHGLCCEVTPAKSRRRTAVPWALLPGHAVEPNAARWVVWTHPARPVPCSMNIHLERPADSPDSVYSDQHSTKRLSRSKISASTVKTGIIAVCVCNSALFTIYDIHMGFSIQITQTTKT